MSFIMGGRQYVLPSLSPEMDEAFQKLHAGFLSNVPYDVRAFRAAAHKFFDSCIGDPGKHDSFFNCFTIIWQNMLQSHDRDAADGLWQLALEPALAWELAHAGNRIHKGTAFYFWGMTAILKGDLDRGYALMHQALEEDVRTHGTELPDTPSLALATLNFSKLAQAFRPWVLSKAAFLEREIATFGTARASTLSIESFKQKFLLNPPNRETVFLFSYVIARLLKLDEIPAYALRSGFVAQLELNLLFDLALVIDATIAPHNKPNWKFIEHAVCLASKQGLPLSLPQLQQANQAFNADFAGTLSKLLDGTFVLQDGSNVTGSAADLAIAYGIRNYGAHHVSSTDTIRDRYKEVRQALFNVLFASVDAFY